MNIYQCNKCGVEFTAGTKFCQNCGCNLEVEFIETPTCPKCHKVFAAGTKFCYEDGFKLVSPNKLIPRCVKCGREYRDGTKYCPEDGGQIVAEANRNFPDNNDNDFVNKTNDTVASVADNIGSQFVILTKQWHGFVVGWTIFALIVSVIPLIHSVNNVIHIMRDSTIEYLDFVDYIGILSSAITIYGIVKLLRKEKSGFTLLVIVAVITAVCNIIFGLVSAAVFGLLTIFIWYAVLQIKKNGITAWSTLE
jgi:hypothetical protein